MDTRIEIRSITIRNFRSIRRENIKTGEFNNFVGTNDAGKSNVLKALNLFFNDQVDCNVPFSFQRDFSYLYPPKSKEAKAITITIQFEIPDSFADAGLYTWEKQWKQTGKVLDIIKNEKGENVAPRSRIPVALQRIKYRYVPAVKSHDYYKTLLSDLYTSVSASLDSTLLDAIESFSNTLGDYTESITNEVFNRLTISSQLTIPNDLQDIFKALIFQTSLDRFGGIKVPLTARGDGIQARHIPIILKYIAKEDQKSRTQGSTKITTIWGFEEPENGLEFAKAFELANEFTEYAHNIQIFVTTHSPAFYMKKEENGAKIFFVEKKGKGTEETCITVGRSATTIAGEMGLMPLVAPFISEQANKLKKAQDIYKKNILTDVPSIMVEGETDVDYLKMAIEHLSPLLNEMIKNDSLRIIYKFDGAGTTQLFDWALSWIYSGFRSKMILLLDKDEAGIKTRKDIIESEAYISHQHSLSMRIMHIEPSDAIIYLYQKNIMLPYEIEHLCSKKVWEGWKEKGLVDIRPDKELHKAFDGLIPRSKTLDNVIDELVDDITIRDTIFTFLPGELKKKQMVDYLRNNHTGNPDAFQGFSRTIGIIEKYFTQK